MHINQYAFTVGAWDDFEYICLYASVLTYYLLFN